MCWLLRLCRDRGLNEEDRPGFRLAASDPMIAIIGAVRRLTDAGMTADDAAETVLRILREEVADGSGPL